ncbi:hypothetical protein ACFS7Z_07060 [Pontibacter toksunensis]|uniref:Uncharacterized protein n=1 Tax=Pontibacter toksunensis TaxID=1332631 RepID=A0ABW6BQJ4_9BACT
MGNEQHSIELKFEGNGIKPSKVRASEVAELITSFEAALLAVVKDNNYEFEDAEVLISFDAIQDKSLSIKCLAHSAKLVLPAFALVATSFTNAEFNNLPSASLEHLRKITKFSKKHKCSGFLIQDGARLAEFDQNTEVTHSDAGTLRGDTTVYGMVLKAGGDNPRVTLKIDDNYTVSFDVKRDIAVKLAELLYKEVGLRGNARWDRKTYKVLDFRADAIVYLEQTDIQKTFQELGQLYSSTFKNIKGLNSFNS